MSQFDIVVFGATSFVGEILCRYMVRQYPAKHPLKWAIAGRSESKLKALKDSLGKNAEHLEVLTADASDEQSLISLCESTSLVISTVGPYALYGEPLVKVCATQGSDYCDLTGEVQWVAKMLDLYEEQAQASGARIVNCCGFDSIPSDLGVYFLQDQARQLLGEACSTVKMRVKKFKGAASGGTIASMTNMMKEATRDPGLLRIFRDHYSLCPKDHPFTARQSNMNSVHYERDFKSWSAPFIMAGINTRVVHRTNALLSSAYGDGFQYNEAMLTGKGPIGGVMAAGTTLGLGGFGMAAVIPPTRWAMESFILPKPGEGPSLQQQENGFYDLLFYGTTDSGKSIRCRVTGDRDPGYGSTGKILAEAAVCLGQDICRTEKPGGFWTPASALGDSLVKRLTDNAGLTFELLED